MTSLTNAAVALTAAALVSERDQALAAGMEGLAQAWCEPNRLEQVVVNGRRCVLHEGEGLGTGGGYSPAGREPQA